MRIISARRYLSLIKLPYVYNKKLREAYLYRYKNGAVKTALRAFCFVIEGAPIFYLISLPELRWRHTVLLFKKSAEITFVTESASGYDFLDA